MPLESYDQYRARQARNSIRIAAAYTTVALIALGAAFLYNLAGVI